MMKNCKILRCIILCVVITVSFISCQISQPPNNFSETLTQEGLSDTLTFYSYESLTPYLKPRFQLDPDELKGLILPDAEDFINEFTAVRSRSVDENHMCSLYRIQHEEGAQGYLLMILEKVGTSWRLTNEYYFFSKALSQSQLSELKVGDDLTALYALDPSIYFDLQGLGSFQISTAENNDVIYKPLKDGILRLVVSAPIESDSRLSEYTISEISFYAYGEDSFNHVEILPNFDADAITWLFAE